MRRKSVLLAAALSAGFLYSGVAGAQPSPLSPEHTALGPSQFWVSNITMGQNTGQRVGLRLANPNDAEHVTATIFYTRALERGGSEGEGGLDGQTEVFRGCLVRRLTPHAAVAIESNEIQNVLNSSDNRLYAETIAAPLDPAQVNGQATRKANGLGVVVWGGAHRGHTGMSQALFPNLFTLPSSLVVPGQREDARACVCSGLGDEGAPPNTFLGFGIDCLT